MIRVCFKQLLLLACMLIVGKASAKFKVGDLYYQILSESEKTAEVTCVPGYESNLNGGYSNLTSVTIPEKITHEGVDYTVTSIGTRAFMSVRCITDITIPNSITYIGEEAFEFTNILDNQPDGDVYFNRVYYKYKGSMPDNTAVVIKDGTVSISPRAFEWCRTMTSISMPNTLERIGEKAFHQCTGLKSITIPNSVTTIDDAAFYECCEVTCVTLGNSVTSIPKSAFSCCYNMAYVNIPSSVTSIGNHAFGRCWSLRNMNIPNTVTSIGKEAFNDCRALESATIPNSITCIEERMFWDCNALTNVTIPNSVTSINEGAFRGCSSLADITIPSSVTSIGYEAFDGTPFFDNLPNGENYINQVYYKYKGTMPDGTSIVIKDGTVSIGGGAFNNCSGLRNIYIPNSVETIGNIAFRNCTGLTNISMPNSITDLGNYTFNGCTGLTNISMPNSITELGDYTFNGCTELKSFTIPNSVSIIGLGTFQKCTNLARIIIPNSVTQISYGAFDECTALKDLFCFVESPSDIIVQSPSFKKVETSKCYLHVLPGSVEAYKAADVWKDFIIVDDAASVESAAADCEDRPIDVYNLQGIAVLRHVLRSEASRLLAPGIYIMGGKKVLVK